MWNILSKRYPSLFLIGISVCFLSFKSFLAAIWVSDHGIDFSNEVVFVVIEHLSILGCLFLTLSINLLHEPTRDLISNLSLRDLLAFFIHNSRLLGNIIDSLLLLLFFGSFLLWRLAILANRLNLLFASSGIFGGLGCALFSCRSCILCLSFLCRSCILCLCFLCFNFIFSLCLLGLCLSCLFLLLWSLILSE